MKGGRILEFKINQESESGAGTAEFMSKAIDTYCRKDNFKTNDITLASEESLANDWLKPEEDEAWQDL